LTQVLKVAVLKVAVPEITSNDESCHEPHESWPRPDCDKYSRDRRGSSLDKNSERVTYVNVIYIHAAAT